MASEGGVWGDETRELTDLLRASARGHNDAFAELYDRTNARVYGVVLRIVRAPDHAAEVTQEVYEEVWRKSARHDPQRGSVLTWMMTIAHGRAVDRIRSVSSAIARDDAWVRRDPPPADDHVWQQVDRQLEAERVRRGLASLTEIQREALDLAYFGGYTQSQVADLLGLPLGTVKTRIRDGLIGLRDAMGVTR